MALTSAATEVVVVACVTGKLAIMALNLRLWSRRMQNIRLGFSDYAVIAAMMFTAATLSLYVLCRAGILFVSSRDS
jgi:hypothetical protein